MSCYVVNVVLPCYRLGDPYLGIKGFGPVTIRQTENDLPVTPSEPLTRVTVKFTRRNKVFILDSDPESNPDQLITITDAVLWVVAVGIIPNFLPVDGDWEWTAKFTSTYFGGALTCFEGILTDDH